MASRFSRPEALAGCAGWADAPRWGRDDAVQRRDGGSVLRELEVLRQQVQQQQRQLERLEGRRLGRRACLWRDGGDGATESTPSPTAATPEGDTGRTHRGRRAAVVERVADDTAVEGGGGSEDEPEWLQEATAVLARGAGAVATRASQDAETWLAARRGGRPRTAAAGRRVRWKAAVRLQRAWRRWGGQCLIARTAARVAAATVLTGRRLLAAESRRQAHRLWRAAVRRAAVRMQRCWRQRLQRVRVARFWAAAATQERQAAHRRAGVRMAEAATVGVRVYPPPVLVACTVSVECRTGSRPAFERGVIVVERECHDGCLLNRAPTPRLLGPPDSGPWRSYRVTRGSGWSIPHHHIQHRPPRKPYSPSISPYSIPAPSRLHRHT